MSTDGSVNLANFISAVRNRLLADRNGDVEDIASTILAAIVRREDYWRHLTLDTALTGEEVEDKIFNVLISEKSFTSIDIPFGTTVDGAEALLRRAIPAMRAVYLVTISIAMTQQEAERIFSILQTSPSLEYLMIFLGSTTDGIAGPLENFLRESPLRKLQLSWGHYEVEVSVPVAIADATVNSICNGIGASTSLSTIGISVPPLEEAIGPAARAIARAVANSESLGRIYIKNWTSAGQSSRTLSNEIFNALMHIDPVKSLDLCFRMRENDDEFQLELNRTSKWKPLLSQDVPLNYWPKILAKTNTWTQEDSHHPLDALFFLIKEKNDALLQNVHRRPIRKRKRVSLFVTYT